MTKNDHMQSNIYAYSYIEFCIQQRELARQKFDIENKITPLSEGWDELRHGAVSFFQGSASKIYYSYKIPEIAQWDMKLSIACSYITFGHYQPELTPCMLGIIGEERKMFLEPVADQWIIIIVEGEHSIHRKLYPDYEKARKSFHQRLYKKRKLIRNTFPAIDTRDDFHNTYYLWNYAGKPIDFNHTLHYCTKAGLYWEIVSSWGNVVKAYYV